MSDRRTGVSSFIDEFYGGYRYFGYWNQVRVYSKKEVLKLISEHAGLDNCGLSISTFIDGMPFLLFVPFDFDSLEDNLENAYNEANRVYDFFKSSGFQTSLNFSGNRGFHVLVKTKPDIYSSRQLRKFHDIIARLLRLKFVDRQLFGDIRRLIRIPGTLHPKTGLLAFTIKSCKGQPLDLHKFITNGLPDAEVRVNSKIKVRHPYPCVEEIIRNDPEPPQLIRFTYVIHRLSEGYTTKEILEEIRSFGWVDFNERITLYQIKHIANGGYYPLSCESIKQLGYCLKDCPYKDKENLRQKWLNYIRRK